MSTFSWQGQNICWLSLAFVIDWRVMNIFSNLPSRQIKDLFFKNVDRTKLCYWPDFDAACSVPPAGRVEGVPEVFWGCRGDVRPPLQEELGHLGVVRVGGPVEWSVPVRVSVVNQLWVPAHFRLSQNSFVGSYSIWCKVSIYDSNPNSISKKILPFLGPTQWRAF